MWKNLNTSAWVQTGGVAPKPLLEFTFDALPNNKLKTFYDLSAVDGYVVRGPCIDWEQPCRVQPCGWVGLQRAACKCSQEGSPAACGAALAAVPFLCHTLPAALQDSIAVYTLKGEAPDPSKVDRYTCGSPGERADEAAALLPAGRGRAACR